MPSSSSDVAHAQTGLFGRGLAPVQFVDCHAEITAAVPVMPDDLEILGITVLQSGDQVAGFGLEIDHALGIRRACGQIPHDGDPEVAFPCHCGVVEGTSSFTARSAGLWSGSGHGIRIAAHDDVGDPRVRPEGFRDRRAGGRLRGQRANAVG